MGLFYTNSGAVANYAPRTSRPTKPASVKQLQFIGTLAQGVDFSADLGRTGRLGTFGQFIRDEYQGMLYNGTLTTRDASLLIDTLKAGPRKGLPEEAKTGKHYTSDTGKFYGPVKVYEIITKDDYRIVKARSADSPHVFSWYDSSYGGVWDEGTTYTIQGRIKAHKDYKGERYTQLNYVKVKG